MFYVAGWIPLVDVMGRIEKVLATRFRAEKNAKAVGTSPFYQELYAETWRVCDTCCAGIIGPNGTVVRLSPKLFTRNNESSRFGDFLCLTIGQLGSGYWRPWFDQIDPYAQPTEYLDPTAYVQPFLYAHVMINDEEDLAQSLVEIAKAKDPAKRGPGRPDKRADFEAVYRQKFPDGHQGHTKQEVIDFLHAEGAPKVSLSTFDRVIRKLNAGT